MSFRQVSVVDPDSWNPDPDSANSVNPDPGLKKLFQNKVLKIEYKWTSKLGHALALSFSLEHTWLFCSLQA